MKEYIEREALVKHCYMGMTRVYDTNWQKGYWDGIDEMADYIQNTPAADVAPVVHGEWIEYSGDPNIITCSECDWGTSPEEKGFKFCPHCGARMDGGK